MNTATSTERQNFLKGVGNPETALRLLQIIMDANSNLCFTFKVILIDERIVYGALIYMDHKYILLSETLEHYEGVTHFSRQCGDVLIPFTFIKSIYIEKDHFDYCYSELKEIDT